MLSWARAPGAEDTRLQNVLVLLIHGVGGMEVGPRTRETSVTFRTVPEVWYLN